MMNEAKSCNEGKAGDSYNREGKYDRSDQLEQKEVIISENVVPELYQYLRSRSFLSTIDRFCEKYWKDFADYHQHDEGKSNELSHEHKEIYDKYQELIENLFEKFAYKYSITIKEIFECCSDVGKLFISSCYVGYILSHCFDSS
jgi:hypothetical protein